MEARMQQQMKATAVAIAHQQHAAQAQLEQDMLLAAEGRMQARFDHQQATIAALSKSLATAENEYEHIRAARVIIGPSKSPRGLSSPRGTRGLPRRMSTSTLGVHSRTTRA
jgi:hypothetical protein